MCGICGIRSYDDRITDKPSFETVTDILTHRGPDGRGTWYDDHVALGHRRLSIIDLSETGAQPLHYIDRYVIVFNGEVYNYIELKEELKKLGYSFLTKTDTEVVVAAYDKWGPDALHRFNGMWSFGLYDRANGKLFCARDRFGVKPFYYLRADGFFAFASEIKALLPMLASKPKANVPRVLDNILYGLCDHTDETMFNGIRQLRAGHYLFADTDGSCTIKQYYDVDDIPLIKRTYDETVAEFKRIFTDAVNLRLRSDVTVGSCLSGGLDSSSIVCTTAKLLKARGEGRHEAVSSCYDKIDEARYDEQEYIDEVAGRTGVLVHKVYPRIDTFFKNLDKIIYHQDEPVGGLSHESQFNVFCEARARGLTVMLDGQGADEELAGYTAFYSVIIREYLRKFDILAAIREIRCFTKLRKKSERFGYQELLWGLIKDFLPAPLRRRIIKASTKREEYYWITVPHDASTTERIKAYRSFDEYTRKAMKYGLLPLLHYEDRNSMAHGIEGRLPFLDFRLVELIVSSRPEYKLKNGVTKRMLRDALVGTLPEKIRNRYSKLGFAVPTDLWVAKYPDLVKKELEEALELLSSILEKKRVMKWFEQNSHNQLALVNPVIWRIISTGRWMRLFDISI